MATRSDRRNLQEQQRAAKNEKNLSSDATKFLLIRHGETDWNKEHRLQGQKDPPLNPLGLKQAQALAERLSQEIPSGPIYSSDLQRASKTAQIILEARNTESTEPNLVNLHPGFREGSIGILEGLTPAEARIKEPEAWAILTGTNYNERVPGGELVSEIERRASQGVDEIASSHIGETVILVTHGGVLQTLYWHCTGQDYPGKFHNCAINTIWVDKGKWVAGLWGDMTHLDGVGVQKEAFGGDLGE